MNNVEKLELVLFDLMEKQTKALQETTNKMGTILDVLVGLNSSIVENGKETLKLSKAISMLDNRINSLEDKERV